MMKKLMMALVLMPMAALAATKLINGVWWEYEIIDGEAVITYAQPELDYDNDAYPDGLWTGGATMVIPSTLGGKSVTKVGGFAAEGVGGLGDLMSGETTVVGKITKVIIPNGVRSIGKDAFFSCSCLTNIVIPKSLKTIEARAFWGCSGLTGITLPSDVKIGDGAFANCYGLMKDNLIIVRGILFGIGSPEANTVIPDTVTAISGYAFAQSGQWGDSNYQSTEVTNIAIPNSVTSIGAYAFRGCSRLTSITIPASVKTIGDGAFIGCTGLAADNFIIVHGGLYGCIEQKRSIVIPDTVTTISAECFRFDRTLESVTIPNSVTSIGAWAFEGCDRLTDLTISVSVTNLGAKAFSGCKGLAKDDLIIVRNVLYGYTGTEEAWCFIPDGVVRIEEEAFVCADYNYYPAHYSGPTNIYIPNSVTSIGEGAFLAGVSGLVFYDVDDYEGSDWVEFPLKTISAPNTLKPFFKSKRIFNFCEWQNDEVDWIPPRITYRDVIVVTVTLDPNGGILPGSNKCNVIYDSPYGDLPVPTRTAYMFEGWTLDGYPVDSDTYVGLDVNHKLVAQWRRIPGWTGICDVAVKPQGGKVTIKYEIAGDILADAPAGTMPVLVVTACDTVTGKTVTSVASALSGDVGHEAGEHEVTWDMAKQGVSVNGSKVVFTVSYVGTSPYCVIDLSAGANAGSYPVSYLDDVPAGGWTEEYKTDKLVLKRIAPGSFTVDEVEYDFDDNPHVIDTYEVSITKPFFMGVFEVTQKQYELVTGKDPSGFKGDTRPVERVSWDDIRGNSSVHDWPRVKTVDGNSFVGRLRARTGVSVDLPTAAQGEYAFRADDVDGTEDLTELGRTRDNVNDGRGGYGEHTEVGSYRPNSWGIYDMYGNVSEWVLDWWWFVEKDETDPVGTISGDECCGRMSCGTSWYDPSWEYGYMDVGGDGGDSDCRNSELGFRLAMAVPDGTVTGGTIWSGDSGPVETAPVYTFFTGYKMTVNVKLKGYAAKGLPSGLKYDAKKGTVSGAAKKATAADGVTVTFTKKGAATVRAVFVVRKEVVSAGCEGLADGTFAAGMRRSGTIPLEISTESGVKAVSVTGLPPGMKFDSKKRVITGFPTKGGTYTVTVKVTGKTGVAKTVKITVHVDALPTFATGTFQGFAETESGKTYGAFTLTAPSTGALTAKIVGASKTYSFSKSGWDAEEDGVYVVELTTKAGDRLSLRVDSTAAWDAQQATGTLTPAAGEPATVSAQRRAFGKTWQFSATGDAQSGWSLAYAATSSSANLTVSLGADGVTTLAGKLGGYSVSATGYANVGDLKNGVLAADFAPIVTVGKGKTAKKLQFVVRTNLWFDRSDEHDEGVGSAYIQQ